MDKNKINVANIMPEPMTTKESLRYIENLESHRFAYDEWELSRDIKHITKFDQLLENCDPRRQVSLV